MSRNYSVNRDHLLCDVRISTGPHWSDIIPEPLLNVTLESEVDDMCLEMASGYVNLHIHFSN